MEEKRVKIQVSDLSIDDVIERLQLKCDELRDVIGSINTPGKSRFCLSDNQSSNDQRDRYSQQVDAADELVDRLKAFSEVHACAMVRFGDWIADKATQKIGANAQAIDGLIIEMHNHILAARHRTLQNFYLLATGGIGVAVGVLIAVSVSLFSVSRVEGPPIFEKRANYSPLAGPVSNR